MFKVTVNFLTTDQRGKFQSVMIMVSALPPPPLQLPNATVYCTSTTTTTTTTTTTPFFIVNSDTFYCTILSELSESLPLPRHHGLL